MRTVSCGGVQFSANGAELLATFNSDHIYLFDVIKSETINSFKVDSAAEISSNKVGHSLTPIYRQADDLPFEIELLKQKANDLYKDNKAYAAIELYNKAIVQCPRSAVLFANRAQALMKRDWLGDLYAAVRDCSRALELDKDYVKVKFRLASCLHQLEWFQDALDVIDKVRAEHPEHADSKTFLELEKDVKEDLKNKSKGPDDEEEAYFRRRTMLSLSSYPENLSDVETVWRENASDYHTRFVGYANVATEKGANFFGR